MKNVAVLMSVFNGEKYLAKQIDSILSQSDINIELFIRDDGSKDSSRSLLEEYEKKDCRIHVNYAENIGVGNSFMKLIYDCPAHFEYYSLADQDDIWESNKIIEAVLFLEKNRKELYGSNQECVNKDGDSIAIRYPKDKEIFLSPLAILETNQIAGCTMVFSNKFREILVQHKPSEALLRNRIHDVWLAMVGSVFECIIYDSRSFMKYRQHENNVVGAYSGGIIFKIKQKCKRFLNSEKRCGRSKLAREICLLFPERADKYPFLGVCADARQLKNKIQLIKKMNELLRYSEESKAGLVFKILFNLF